MKHSPQYLHGYLDALDALTDWIEEQDWSDWNGEQFGQLHVKRAVLNRLADEREKHA